MISFENYIGIDTGEKKTAFAVYSPKKQKIIDKDIVNNDLVFEAIKKHKENSLVGIELIECFGFVVGRSVFETAVWTGRFLQFFVSENINYIRVYRRDYKLHFCNSLKARDSNVKANLETIFRNKKNFFDGVKKDIWQALAIALYVYDLNRVYLIKNFQKTEYIKIK